MTSPSRTERGRITRSCVRTPMPAVFTKSASPLPRSTTFVSPVTMRTPATSAVRRIDASTRARTSIGRPSSAISAQLRKSGLAPTIARSFTVPETARVPMSPPGKKSGFTT